MLKSTRDAIRTSTRAICATAPSVTAAQVETAIAAFMSALDGVPVETEPFDQILTPEAAGKLLGGRDRHTLANWVKRGLLRAVRTGAGGKRITGYTASSVRALLAGKANANADGKEVA